MKKLLLLAVMLATICGSSSAHLAYADSGYGPGYTNIATETNDNSITNQSLSEYMKTVYTATAYPELDEAVFNAFKIFETNKNSNSMVTAYTASTLEECVKFRDYFNLNYGYTYDIRLNAFKSGNSYICAFDNTLNADEKINSFLVEVKKAQEIAKSLNTGTSDTTIVNIINWVKNNAKYYYTRDVDNETYFAHYYGIYSGKEVLCEGYAMAVYQLCAMNGINCTLVDMVSPAGVAHVVNQVSYSDKIRWVDTTKINPVSDELWTGYTYLK